VLARMAEKELRFYKNIARQKMAYAGHVLKDWTQLRNYSEMKRTAEDKTI